MPRTDTAPLAGLVSHLSELAADFADLVPECDLNSGHDPQGIRRRPRR